MATESGCRHRELLVALEEGTVERVRVHLLKGTREYDGLQSGASGEGAGVHVGNVVAQGDETQVGAALERPLVHGGDVERAASSAHGGRDIDVGAFGTGEGDPHRIHVDDLEGHGPDLDHGVVGYRAVLVQVPA